MAVRKKQYNDISVYESSKNRIRYLYRRFDNIVVSFSGGKDSTAVLNLVIEVARELNRLPVTAIFFDEEAIHPPTIEYVQRVADNPDVKLEWYCLPVKHRNACSNEQPYWYCWNPEEKDLWIRPLPATAITSHPLFNEGDSWQEFSDKMFTPENGTICSLTGVRTQESFRRMKAVSAKKNDNYITQNGTNGFIYTAYPIYDWSSEDVWKLVAVNGLDYNKTYDIFNRTRHYGMLLAQRVCPPFGEEPLRGLWLYAECFPEMWHKMLSRVKGVATAWRYANTEIYGVGKMDKPSNVTWREYAEYILDTYADTDKPAVKKNLNTLITKHFDKTHDAIHEEDIHPLTGTSWKLICKIAVKGDLKGRTAPKLENEAINAQKRLGITSYEQAIMMYGTEAFIKKNKAKINAKLTAGK